VGERLVAYQEGVPADLRPKKRMRALEASGRKHGTIISGIGWRLEKNSTWKAGIEEGTSFYREKEWFLKINAPAFWEFKRREKKGPEHGNAGNVQFRGTKTFSRSLVGTSECVFTATNMEDYGNDYQRDKINLAVAKRAQTRKRPP